MKTTKEIAELFCAELEHIAKTGEVRSSRIRGLGECSDALIKLARLEMDFAFRNWGEQPPSIPWMATKPMLALAVPPEKPEPRNTPTASTSRGQQLEKEIENAQKQLKTANATMKTILTDKINLLQNKLERAEAQKDSEAGDD